MRANGWSFTMLALASAVALACAAAPPKLELPLSGPGELVAALEADTDRAGADYVDFALASARPEECREACLADQACAAFTYVHPGIQGDTARCWLKSGVAAPATHRCCVSGVKKYVSYAERRQRYAPRVELPLPPAPAPMPTPAPPVPTPEPAPAPSPAGASGAAMPAAPGSGWSELVLPQASPDLCRDACDDDSECRGFSYVNAGIGGPNARCLIQRDPDQEAPPTTAAKR